MRGPLVAARSTSVRASLAAIVLLTAGPEQQYRLLADLSPGDKLTGRIKAHHNRKLYLSVPVERAVSSGKMRPVDAYVTLPTTHELMARPKAAMGKTLDCYVVKAQPNAARLSVDLRPPGLRVPRRRRKSARELASPDWALRLEDLTPGMPISGVVSNVCSFGVFVHVNVSRGASGGVRKPVDACLLPADQMLDGQVSSLVAGQELEGLAVLKASRAQGRLLLTARPAEVAEMTRQANERAAARKRLSRRPSLASLARKVGEKREGTITRVEEYGAVVNVGARRPGLIHISQLGGDTDGPKGNDFVSDPNDIVQVGDRVVVSVLPRSNEKRLSLRLVKVFPRNDAEAREQQSTLRGGETLRPQYTRADDALQETIAGFAAVDAAASEEAAWAQYEAAQQAASEEDEDDPFAWAAADAPSPPAKEDDVEDPFAWAAADAPSAPAKPVEEDPFAWAAAAQEEEADVEEPAATEATEAGGDGFDDDYFNDKYEEDFY